MGWVCSTHGENDKYVHKLTRKAHKEVPTWKPRRKWENKVTRNVGGCRLDSGESGSSHVSSGCEHDKQHLYSFTKFLTALSGVRILTNDSFSFS